MKKHRKILQKCIVGSLTAILCIPFLTTVQDVEAYSKVSGSYNSLSAADKAAFNKYVGNSSSITGVSVSSPSVTVEGTRSPSSYQWTAWYNENNKDFSINKAQTSGNYQVGVPTKTSSRSLQTNLKRVGYYKYLSDPIYSEIRLKATKTFNYSTQSSSTSTTNTKLTGSNAISKAYSLGVISYGQKKKIYDTIENKNKNQGNSCNATGGGWTGSAGYSPSEYKKINQTKTTYNTANKKIVETTQIEAMFVADIQMCHSTTIYLKLKTTTKTTVYENHSKTIEVANTVVAKNVSATELSKYASFKLVSKNGGTSPVNTSVSKSSAGWWGGYNPPYHQGNTTTSDSSGTYYYWSNSKSGSNAQSLRSLISQTEKVHSFKATATNQTTTHKYTLSINPSGGSYNGNTGITNVKQAKASTYTVSTPTRDGYQFAGWDFSGGGTWNPATNKYTYSTGDATLTAKWVKNHDDGPNPNKDIKYTLTIDPNGGKYKGKTDATKVTKSEGDIYSINNPIRSGYTFVGWQVVSGNSACFSQGTNTSAVRFYDNLTIKAQWIKNKESSSTVTIDPNGGTYNGSTGTKTISGSTGETTFISKPTRPGYVFAGWEVVNLGNNKFNGSTFTFVQGNTTLKARWEALIIPSCVIGGSGANACPDDSPIRTWFYLTKNLD